MREEELIFVGMVSDEVILFLAKDMYKVLLKIYSVTPLNLISFLLRVKSISHRGFLVKNCVM